MEQIKPNSTEFMLYSLGSDEENYIFEKHQINPFYHVTTKRFIYKYNLSKELFKINRNLTYVDKCWSYMKENELEFELENENKKNIIYEELISLEQQAKNSINKVSKEIEQLKKESSEIEKQIKDQLRKCLDKNLLTSPEAILNSLFTSKNIHDILSAFEKEDEFFKYAKEKEKEVNLRNPNDPIRYLAKASAIKTVSPLISLKEREKNIKTNLTKIKGCISDAESTLREFIQKNEFETNAEENALLQRLQNINKEISSYITVNCKRKISEHKFSQKIEDRAKEKSVIKESSDENAPLCASLIKSANTK